MRNVRRVKIDLTNRQKLNDDDWTYKLFWFTQWWNQHVTSIKELTQELIPTLTFSARRQDKQKCRLRQ